MKTSVHIIGGGLAGSEAAWACARAGVPAILHEMRGLHGTDAHHTDQLAELVCSNSFRSDDADNNAVGLLHAEMRALGSLVMAAADAARVPAGSALAVDRDDFAARVTAAIEAEPLIEIRREMIDRLPPADWDNVIIATGPLTATPFAEAIRALTGEDQLAFFDAIAPVIHVDSIDRDIAWAQSRWDRPNEHGDTKDYLNCPLDKDQYNAFVDAMLAAEKADFKDWEASTPYFDGCMPIEVMVERGRNTPRFGPMKPVGLTNPATGRRAWAVVQLRQDNALGSLWNMVGFQTKMKHAEQVRVFRMIPGLERAEFARLGGLHRNTFIKSPVLLDAAAPSDWRVAAADAILCINMVHISPWAATEGLFVGAAQILAQNSGSGGGPLILYGPFFEQGAATAPSNLDFDASLKARDPRWGLRHAEELDRLAGLQAMARSARYRLPANNIMLVYRPERAGA